MRNTRNGSISYDFDMEELRKNGPSWKAGDHLIIEYLDLACLNAMGEDPQSDGVVRLWLADDEYGSNRKRLIDINSSLEDDERIKKAMLNLATWADGFILASNLKGEPMGYVMKAHRKIDS